GDAATPREKIGRAARILAPCGVAMLLALSLLASGTGLLTWQPSAYAHQLSVARASTPLLYDPLTSDAGVWPANTSDPNRSHTFSNGAYTLNSQDDYDVSALERRVIGDGVLQVTLRYTTDFDLNTAGLILRTDEASHTKLVFVITPSGEWHLYRLALDGQVNSWARENQLMYEGVLGPIGAIHQGLGATNQLAVLMRGNAYAFFINDQYVGCYRDDGGPTRGYVGMYVGSYGGIASFRDFGVFPVPPPTLLAPI
ncbi:MAG TPA: hypothetical protein VF120_10935, partial [Ktedonobacterales bacterium]